jgi:hypothetical protein
MTTVRTLSNQGEAAFLLSVLQGNGFEAVLLDEGAFQYTAVMTAMRIQVPDQQASEAIEFLKTAPELKSDLTYPEDDANDA